MLRLNYIECSQVNPYNLQIKFYFSEDSFYLANSVDPAKMVHYAAFHLGLHGLPFEVVI